MKEFDLVALTIALPDLGLAVGATGTIVDDPPQREGVPRVFIVEFPGADEENFDDWRVEYVEASHLRVLTEAEYKALRSQRVAAE